MEVQKTIDVIYKDDDLVAFYKPKNLPTVPLKGQECDTLLSLGAKAFPEILSPYGKNPWEGTILHRVDTPTSGSVIAARNKEKLDAAKNETGADASIAMDVTKPEDWNAVKKFIT